MYGTLFIIIFCLFASRPSVGSHMVQFLNSVYAQLCESPALHRFKQQNDSSKNLLLFFFEQLFAGQKYTNSFNTVHSYELYTV